MNDPPVCVGRRRTEPDNAACPSYGGEERVRRSGFIVITVWGPVDAVCHLQGMEIGGSPDRYSYLHPNPDGTPEINDLSKDPRPMIRPPGQMYLGGFNNDPEFTRPEPPEDYRATHTEVAPVFTRPVRDDGRKAPDEDYARRIAPSESAF